MASKIKPVEIRFSAVDRVTATVTRINTKLAAMQAPVRNLTAAFSKLHDVSGFNRVHAAATRVGSSIFSLAKGATLIGGALGGAAVFGMKKFISSAHEIHNMANAAGLTVEELQELRFAGERAGVSTEKLDAGVRIFTTTLGAARIGTGALTKLLKRQSPELLRNLRTAKSAGDAFDIFMDAAERAETPAKRNLLLKAGIGKGGPLFGPLVGSIRELRQEARDTGQVLSEETIEAAAKTAIEFVKAGKTAHALSNVFFAELLPATLDLVRKLNEFIGANRELVRGKVVEFARKTADALLAIADATPKVVNRVSEMIEWVGGWKAALVGIAAVITGPLIASLATLSAALLFTPAGEVLLGLAAIAAGSLTIAHYWDDITEAVGRFAARVRAIPGFSAFGQEAPWTPTPGPGLGTVLDQVLPDVRRGQASTLNGTLVFRFEGASPRLQSVQKSQPELDFEFRGPSMSIP